MTRRLPQPQNGSRLSYREDFKARFQEALETGKPMAPPKVRVTMPHEQEAA